MYRTDCDLGTFRRLKQATPMQQNLSQACFAIDYQEYYADIARRALTKGKAKYFQRLWIAYQYLRILQMY